jgi:hypothetical protein
MRMPRLTLRRLMILVALLAVPLAFWGVLERRRSRFEHLSSYHRGLAGPALWPTYEGAKPIFPTEQGRGHDRLAVKYAEAARRPWMPVEDDPPEPR